MLYAERMAYEAWVRAWNAQVRVKIKYAPQHVPIELWKELEAATTAAVEHWRRVRIETRQNG